MSRLWTDPPLKPDGSLDYARLTLAEICEDLTDSLMDRIINGHDDDLAAYLGGLPEVGAFPAGASPSDALVGSMEELLRLEGEDADFRTPRTRDVLGRAIRALGEAARGPI